MKGNYTTKLPEINKLQSTFKTRKASNYFIRQAPSKIPNFQPHISLKYSQAQSPFWSIDTQSNIKKESKLRKRGGITGGRGKRKES